MFDLGPPPPAFDLGAPPAEIRQPPPNDFECVNGLWRPKLAGVLPGVGIGGPFGGGNPPVYQYVDAAFLLGSGSGQTSVSFPGRAIGGETADRVLLVGIDALCFNGLTCQVNSLTINGSATNMATRSAAAVRCPQAWFYIPYGIGGGTTANFVATFTAACAVFSIFILRVTGLQYGAWSANYGAGTTSASTVLNEAGRRSLSFYLGHVFNVGTNPVGGWNSALKLGGSFQGSFHDAQLGLGRDKGNNHTEVYSNAAAPGSSNAASILGISVR